MNAANELKIAEICAANVSECGIYCIRNKKSPGSQAKVTWVRANSNKQLRIRILHDNLDRQLGFIEFTPSEFAWRPVYARNYIFIHCIAVFGNASKGKHVASSLLAQCELDARSRHKSGVCVMTSDGPWIAANDLFLKNGYTVADRLGRFELLVKQFDSDYPMPELIDWTTKLPAYKGWHLVYADQCPWHMKAVTDISATARERGIRLQTRKLTTAREAQHAPSGYGTFALIKDGKLLADHYISRTRFENILRKELKPLEV